MAILGNLFKRKGDRKVVGIDIGSSAVKVVQLSRKKGKAVLETYGALALGPYAGLEVGKATNLSTSKLIEILSDILREANITTNIGAIAVPFNSSLVTIIELPSVSEKHLKNIIPLEAKKYVPVPIKEVSLDWSIIPRDEVEKEEDPKNAKNKQDPKDKTVEKIKNFRSKIEVLIVAIHNDVLGKFREIVKSVSLQVNIFEIEIFSTLRAVAEQRLEPVMIMDIGAASTKLYIIERGNIEMSHTVNRGSQDITATISRSLGISIKEAEIMKRTKGLAATEDRNLNEAISISLDYIFAETNKVIRSFEEKRGENVRKIILVGGGSAMKGIAESANANLQVEAILGDPFAKIETPAFVSDLLRDNGPEFAVACGVALRALMEE